VQKINLKLVEGGKGILQHDLGLSEEKAYLALLSQSRQKPRPDERDRTGHHSE
jgi:AmiR/NasT family two-component response regulator